MCGGGGGGVSISLVFFNVSDEQNRQNGGSLKWTVAWCLKVIKGAAEEPPRPLEAEQRRYGFPPGIPGPKSWERKITEISKKKKKKKKKRS